MINECYNDDQTDGARVFDDFMMLSMRIRCLCVDWYENVIMKKVGRIRRFLWATT